MMSRRITAALSLANFALAQPARSGGLYISEFGTSTLGTASAGASAGTDGASTAIHNPAALTRTRRAPTLLGFGALYDWSEFTRIGPAFEWLNLRTAEVDNATVKGDYRKNDMCFFGFNVKWKKLPWSDRGTF